jgi:hypothetical protein
MASASIQNSALRWQLAEISETFKALLTKAGLHTSLLFFILCRLWPLIRVQVGANSRARLPCPQTQFFIDRERFVKSLRHLNPIRSFWPGRVLNENILHNFAGQMSLYSYCKMQNCPSFLKSVYER